VGTRTVFQLHDHAFEGVLRFFVRNFQQLQDDRLVLAEHFARCNAEQAGRNRFDQLRR
jgi:hypothetical protein